jgi:hypothetical protein
MSDAHDAHINKVRRRSQNAASGTIQWHRKAPLKSTKQINGRGNENWERKGGTCCYNYQLNKKNTNIKFKGLILLYKTRKLIYNFLHIFLKGLIKYVKLHWKQ